MSGFNGPSSVPAFAVLYDIRGDGWELARRHVGYWKRRFVHIDGLDENHIAITFFPSRDPKWQMWEACRKDWIYRELVEASAPTSGKAGA